MNRWHNQWRDIPTFSSPISSHLRCTQQAWWKGSTGISHKTKQLLKLWKWKFYGSSLVFVVEINPGGPGLPYFCKITIQRNIRIKCNWNCILRFICWLVCSLYHLDCILDLYRSLNVHHLVWTFPRCIFLCMSLRCLTCLTCVKWFFEKIHSNKSNNPIITKTTFKLKIIEETQLLDISQKHATSELSQVDVLQRYNILLILLWIFRESWLFLVHLRWNFWNGLFVEWVWNSFIPWWIEKDVGVL